MSKKKNNYYKFLKNSGWHRSKNSSTNISWGNWEISVKRIVQTYIGWKITSVMSIRNQPLLIVNKKSWLNLFEKYFHWHKMKKLAEARKYLCQ